MDLHQHVHAEFQGQRFQVPQLRGLQRGHDQQDAVGAHRPRLDHLIGIDDEILAQHGQRARGAGAPQVVLRPLEELHVGQHGQAGRAMRGIRGRDLAGLEVLAQQALGRRGLLDLGDHAGVASRHLGLDRLRKTPNVLPGLGFAPQVGLAAKQARGGDFFGLYCQYALENVTHDPPIKIPVRKRLIAPPSW